MADVTISSLPLGTPSGNGLIPFSNGSSTLATSPSGIVAASPGSVIQVKQGLKTDTQTFNTAVFNDVVGLSVNMTPKSFNSSFLINVQLSLSTPYTQAPYVRIVRNDGINTTPIGIADAAGNRTRCNSIMYSSAGYAMVTIPIFYLDTPTYNTLSPLIYKVQIYANSGPSNGNVGVNYYSGGDQDAATQPRMSSTIIVQEIAG